MPNIEEIIRKAMEEGAFDNLRGKGHPLNLDMNPYVEPEWQLAYHLLKENGFAPSFIELRQDIDKDHATARQTLAQAWQWRQEAVAAETETAWVESQWQRAVAAFVKTVEALNRRIADYNLSVPLDRLQRKKINVDEELQALRG